MKSNTKINKWSFNARILWIYTKYQIITKSLLALVLLPSFNWISKLLINMSGITNLTSSNYKDFILSIYGIPVILLGIVLLIFILGIDINTFIILSSLIREGKLNIKIKNVLNQAIKSIKYFFSPLGIILVLYTAIIFPIVGMGIKMGPLKNFKIPNFITSVIFNNPIYKYSYYTALIVLFLIGAIYIFSVHFIILDNKKILDSFKSSRKLMQKYWKKFIIDYFITIIKISLIFLLIGTIIMVAILSINMAFSEIFVGNNIEIIVMFLSLLEIFAFFTFIMIPISISIVTNLYYKYNKMEGHIVKINLVPNTYELKSQKLYTKIKIKTKIEIITLFIIIVSLNFGLAIIMEKQFSEFFNTKIDMELIAHRGGGDLGAENTIQGIKNAINAGASWTEIDVQRTKDGSYIINHDATFKRVAGINKTPMEMTLSEIKNLKVTNEFSPNSSAQPVPTLEEILDFCKGKIGVFVELKEKSADTKMVDDVIKMIRDKNMLNECVILSLDYDIIKYTHDNYPEIKTGFLYFFSIGDLADLNGDYLIMEEREASQSKVDKIHSIGKKAIVWTVNTPKSIDKFIKSNVDGIITDHIPMLTDAINKANERTHIEIILDSFITQ